LIGGREPPQGGKDDTEKGFEKVEGMTTKDKIWGTDLLRKWDAGV